VPGWAKGQNCAPEGGVGVDNGEKLFWKINSCFILFDSVLLRVAGCELQVAGCGLRVAGYELRVTSCGFRSAQLTTLASE